MNGNSVLKKLEDISSKLSQMLSEAELANQQQATEPKSGFFNFLSKGGKSLPKKTNIKHKCNDGVERVVYKQGNDHFVKRKSSNGKMKFYKVKL